MQKKFGLSVKAYRLELGLSQEKFAELIHHNRTYVGAVERGERNLTLCTVEKFCAILDVDPLAMLAGPHPISFSTSAPLRRYTQMES